MKNANLFMFVMSFVMGMSAQAGGDGEFGQSVNNNAVAKAAGPTMPEKKSETLYSGGSPNGIESLRYLQHLGIKTIVDLQGGEAALKVAISETRGEREKERVAAQSIGLVYIPVPLPAMAPINAREEAQIRAAIRYMIDPAHQPVYVHCLLGNDRTGLMVALYRVYVEGWTPQRAHDEFKNSHWGVSGLFTSQLDRFFKRVTSTPGWLNQR